VVAANRHRRGVPNPGTKLRNDIEIPGARGHGPGRRPAAQFRTRCAAPCRLHERRAFLRDAVVGEAAQAAMAGDRQGRRTVPQALAKGVAAKVKVSFIAGKGPPDLLTLRAVRTLGAPTCWSPTRARTLKCRSWRAATCKRLSPDEAGAKRWSPWPLRAARSSADRGAGRSR